MSEHQEAVGSYVRSERRAALLSQDALAERAGVSVLDLARLESGVVRSGTTLATVLGALCGTRRPAEVVLLSQVPQQRPHGVPARPRQRAGL